MRNFETGATRDSEEGKFDYEGFLSPLVIQRFGQYMHQHRKQADGNLRASDNWQKGIPKEVYRKSLIRHTMDIWLCGRDLEDVAVEDLETALCAVMFNTMGMLYEVLEDARKEPTSTN